MRAFLLGTKDSSDPIEVELTVDERYDTNIATANVNSIPDGYSLSFNVGAKPGVILDGFNIKFTGKSGKVWYSFDNNQETEVTENLYSAMPGNVLKIRGENKEIGKLAIKVGNNEWQDLNKTAFKSSDGVTINNVNGATTVVEVEYVESINFDVEWKDTFINAWMNGKAIYDESQEYNLDTYTFKGSRTNLGTTDPTKKNEITFQERFGDYPVAKYIINNVEYTKEDAKSIGQLGQITFEVPGASSYKIRGEADKTAEKELTIIWANPEYVTTDEEWSKEFQLENGSAYVKAVYNAEGKELDPKDYGISGWSEEELKNGVDKNGFGMISPREGDTVVFRFVPEYGYQLTNIKINGQSIGAGENMNEFVFKMPGTNVHFDAEFEKKDDVLKADSEKVSSGSVSLGKNTLTGGTAQLTVKDVELSADKIKGFTDAAGDYNVTTYLDIDLYQVFYKGKDDDSDVWSNKIDELGEYVTISIKLADGVDANNIVIVHNVHDGDEYEVIEIDSYDPETNVITFRTKSFSNYAIATKEGTANPKTGDNVAIYATVFVIATLGLVVTVKNIME